ncbi:MAG: segregation/condensation protein A [Endozoicomonadaceae bacterium]|nr:segregation/condensation protein A [Endozoicomonadaceae bacterium]
MPCLNHQESQSNTVDVVLVKGEAFTKIPDDLYIPPDAFRIFLDAFQGPLDLLLYLIKRNNMNILDIKIAPITAQYMSYVGMMNFEHFELAGEYLVMAATLAEIKSRFLLPQLDESVEEEDPRAELVRRLQEYEHFQKIAYQLDALPRVDRDVLLFDLDFPIIEKEKIYPDIHFKEILQALSEVLDRAKLYDEHTVEREVFPTRERMLIILNRLNDESSFIPFSAILLTTEGRMGVIVTFLALMELVREACVELIQNEDYGVIHIKLRSNHDGADG